MAISTQDSLVPYRPGFDIVIPHGLEPVPALQARDKEPVASRPAACLRRRSYAYRPPAAASGGIYSATGSPAALAVETMGRIIDIHA